MPSTTETPTLRHLSFEDGELRVLTDGVSWSELSELDRACVTVAPLVNVDDYATRRALTSGAATLELAELLLEEPELELGEALVERALELHGVDPERAKLEQLLVESFVSSYKSVGHVDASGTFHGTVDYVERNRRGHRRRFAGVEAAKRARRTSPTFRELYAGVRFAAPAAARAPRATRTRARGRRVSSSSSTSSTGSGSSSPGSSSGGDAAGDALQLTGAAA